MQDKMPSPEEIRQMYEEEEAATPEEAAATAKEVAEDPEQALNMLHVIMSMSGKDPVFMQLLEALLQSVVLDLLHQRMQQSPEFALVMGKRMIKLLDIMAPGFLQGYAKQPRREPPRAQRRQARRQKQKQ